MPNGAHSGLGRGRFFVKVGPTPAPWRLALHSGLSSTWSRPHGARAEEPTNGSIRTMPACGSGRCPGDDGAGSEGLAFLIAAHGPASAATRCDARARVTVLCTPNGALLSRGRGRFWGQADAGAV